MASRLPVRPRYGWVNPNKGRADRPMTPPTHAASSMCFAPASEVLDPPPDTSGGDVKGLHTAGLPRPKNQRARRAEERPRTRAAPAATQGGRGTSQAARSKHPHPSSGCYRWSAAQRRPRAAPRPRALHMPATMTDARQVMVRPMVRAGAGFHTLAVASTTEQALEATFFPGHLPQVEERYVTDCCAAQVQARVEACEVRWRGAHQALAQTSSVEARQTGVLGRLRSSWRRSAAICWRT